MNYLIYKGKDLCGKKFITDSFIDNIIDKMDDIYDIEYSEKVNIDNIFKDCVILHHKTYFDQDCNGGYQSQYDDLLLYMIIN